MKSKTEQILQEFILRYPVLKSEKKNIETAYLLIRNSYENNGKLLIAGNGGSAADAEHIVGELMKGFVKKRRVSAEFANALKQADGQRGSVLAERLQQALPAIALVDHVALSTAFLNDVDPILGFAQQIVGYGMAGDVFLGISTSGNSENILYACTVARAKGMKVVGLTGNKGGKLVELADVSIVAPETETYKIQELHLPIYHVLCLMLEEYFFEE